MTAKRTESDLVRACIVYLKSRGILAWRNQVGAFKSGDRFVRVGHTGQADIYGVLPMSGGRFLSVEAKVGRNKPTPHQLSWQASVSEHGGLAFVVYSVDELERGLKNAGIK